MPGKTNSPANSAYRSNASNPFARALQEIGGTTVKQAAALPGQMVGDAFESIFGGGNAIPESSNSLDQQQNQLNPFAQALEKSMTPEQRAEVELEKQRAVRHKETQLTEVFNFREQKDKETIKQLQLQLQALAREIKQLDQSTHTAIYAEVVNPGTYHVNFFQQLLKFVVMLRKQVAEANTWIENFNARSKKKGAFWGQVYSKKGGTAYMMSQEHQVARNVG